ncbi:hypothetical protein [Sinomonas albida]|uniref:hypothetical protein n=1 Tax=Sinomonas albida TaxID=369942 RepID=UPI0010A7668A|nr:hypothetical protein [Sinomonas albida]
MKAARAWMALVVVTMVQFLSACGSGPVATPEPGRADPTQTQASPARSPSPSALSTTRAAPIVACAPFVPTAPCTTYVSVSGRDDGGDLSWMTPGAITAKLESVDTALYLTAVTPCGPLSGPVAQSGSTLTPGAIAVGASGCASSQQAGDQAFLIEFLKKPFAAAYSDGHLTWTNEKGSLVFAPR